MIATLQESLTAWLETNQLNYTFIDDQILEIKDFGKFLIIEPRTLRFPDGGKLENAIFDGDFQINLSDRENELVDNVDYLLFQFGNRWYYVNDLVPESLVEFKYLGTANLTFSDTKFPFLSIHGGYELCNGSRVYKDWIKKAKFLNVDTLGICELNTLAGTLPFQEECLKAGLKSIIGETVTILCDDKSRMHVKLYVENETGWENLLWINKLINVDNTGEYITWEQFQGCNTHGLIVVLTPEVNLKKYLKTFQNCYKLYYQLDFVEWASDAKDEQWLKSLKDYFDNWVDKIDPILICDAYYLDKEDHPIKKLLNNIGKVGFRNQSKDQHFKSIDEVYLQAASLFAETDERWNLFLEIALDSLQQVCNAVNFKIPTGVFRLPEFEGNWNEMEREQLESEGLITNAQINEDLFFTLINEGYEQKIAGKVADEQIYLDRMEEEIDVIKRGGFIDYFLILHDILNWCKEQGIWVGLGRGSAAGSLISYLLDIVKIDPIHYKLLFSRFLNAGRIGKMVQKEFVIIKLEDKNIELPVESDVLVRRGGKELNIKAGEILENDNLIKW